MNRQLVARPIATTVARRRELVLRALGVAWLIDGLLQLQPYFFTDAFPQSLSQATSADPSWLSGPLNGVIGLARHQPALTNTLFAAVQVAIGLGILLPRVRRPAILASIAWAAIVWVVGENLGNIPTGATSLPAGTFPGAALLYVAVALVALPRSGRAAPSYAASVADAGMLGRRGAAVLHVGMWSTGAVVCIVAGAGAPTLLQGTVGCTVAAAVCVAVAAVPFVQRSRRTAIVLTLGLLLATWVTFQALGGLFSGQATDIAEAPLLALLLVTFWPARSMQRDSPGPARATGTWLSPPPRHTAAAGG